MNTPLLYDSYIARAYKNHVQMLKIYEQTVESIDKLKNDNFSDELYLLREANMYANDLNNVAFNLAQVTFKIDRAKQAHRDLQYIIDILCDLAGAIHRSFHYDHKKVKTELKNNLKSATHVAERLLALIRLDDIHEHKEEILNNQADVLLAVDRVCLTNMLKFLNLQQLQDVFHNAVDKIAAILPSLDAENPYIQQIIIQCSNHSLQHNTSCADYLSKAITMDHFNDEIKNLFRGIIKAINLYVVDMHQVMLRNGRFDQLVADMHKTFVDGLTPLAKLIPLLAEKENAEVSNSGMELIVYSYSKAAGSVIQLRRSLENVKNDN